MDLAKDILIRHLLREETTNSKIGATDIVETDSLKALQKIKAIIENDSLDDFECIEEIIYVFEEIGSNGGSRHDFG